mgnify:CR=1 FL=1
MKNLLDFQDLDRAVTEAGSHVHTLNLNHSAFKVRFREEKERRSRQNTVYIVSISAIKLKSR